MATATATNRSVGVRRVRRRLLCSASIYRRDSVFVSPIGLSLPFVYINTYIHRAHHRLATNTDTTTTTTTTRLALEVKEAVESDPLYGPASDRAKHYIGIEYEIILERGLKNLGTVNTYNTRVCSL